MLVYFIFYALLSLSLHPTPVAANPNIPPKGEDPAGSGCPHCQDNDSAISRLLEEVDSLYDSFKSKEAEKVLLKIIELDPHHNEGLIKLARVYIDLGDIIPESTARWKERRVKQYYIAEKFAHKAVATNPDGTWGHFYLAASLGRVAMHSSVSEQLDLAPKIRDEAKKAIALDPDNGFAYHILGVWNRRIAKISQLSRFIANTVLWRSVPDGSLEKSMYHLKRATSLNPANIIHHLELAKTYVAMGKQQLAMNHLRKIQELSIQFSDDPLHKENAQRLLQELKEK
jgi:tetratricopeptide (TPR) repeat protein